MSEDGKRGQLGWWCGRCLEAYSDDGLCACNRHFVNNNTGTNISTNLQNSAREAERKDLFVKVALALIPRGSINKTLIEETTEYTEAILTAAEAFATKEGTNGN